MARGGGGYASGKYAVAICDRCADKIPYRKLKDDGQNPSLRVCPDCWDMHHPQEYLPDTFDPVTLYKSTGDPERLVAGGDLTVSTPWGTAPEGRLFYGIGVGFARAFFTDTGAEGGGGSGDAFDSDAFDSVSFDSDAFDL